MELEKKIPKQHWPLISVIIASMIGVIVLFSVNEVAQLGSPAPERPTANPQTNPPSASDKGEHSGSLEPPQPNTEPHPGPSSASVATDIPYIVFNSKAAISDTLTDKWGNDDRKNTNAFTLNDTSTFNTYVFRPKLDFSTMDVVANTTSSTNDNTLTTWQDTRMTDTSGYRGIRVNFATDRQYMVNDNKIIFTSDPGNVSYGYCYVSIPPRHQAGVIESPSILRLEFDEDPQKHVMILKTELLSHEAFTKDINWLAEVSKSGSAFVFIHGFNVGFDDAAKRTAQMAYDLNFDGVPIFYSWPSQDSATPFAYAADERNIELSEDKIKDFLVDILSDTKFSNVFVVGHSMGTRGLSKAIGAIAEEKPALIGKLKAIILAAPDIDADLFKQKIAPRLLNTGKSVTLYASSNDKALSLSQTAHRYPRAGDSGAGLVILKGMDTIDASNVDTSFLGHTYYGDVRSIIDDMHYIIQESLPADKRAGLSPTGFEPNKYWRFKP
ncbi:Esterase/lipase superfamily enzyme [Pseudomonas arsenicoxydans]|uniref:Esterase/lipase superfamily enzyme n=2 Tax=Pseudomonas arsenicoxydans TaxID=702115 RepID=A0A1H0NWU7_9PSED|nr:Esterase/lipase superfamily enzyme [Pseudomonas arsenicoxydans]